MRRIKKAKIEFISLVPAGANKLPVIYKGEGDSGPVEFDTVVKATADAGELTAIVYAAEHRDSQGDIASADVIREMAHTFQKEGGQIDMRHDGKPVGKDRAYVAESFIVQKGDPRFADLKDRDDKAVDAEGAWAVVIKIDDPELRRLYREGEWGGVSMAGRAEVVVTEKSGETDDEPPGWFRKALRALGLGGDSQEIDMKKEDLEALFDTKLKPIADRLDKLEKADAGDGKPDAGDGKPDAGDDKPDLAQLVKDAVAEAMAGEITDAEAGIEKDDSDKVKSLKRELAKERRRNGAVSKQASGGDRDDRDDRDGNDDLAGLSKEARDLVSAGRRMADFVNEDILGLPAARPGTV